jgi:mRNA interferase MazF
VVNQFGSNLSKISAADTFQVRSLSQERFIQQIGLLTNTQLDAIGKALATVLAIK